MDTDVHGKNAGVEELRMGSDWTANADLPTASADRQHVPPAALIRRELGRAGVLGLRLVGAPSSGKTSLIEAAICCCNPLPRMALLLLNSASENEMGRLSAGDMRPILIENDLPKALAIWRAVAQLRLDDFDIVLLEDRGGRTPLLDLGQDAIVAVISITDCPHTAEQYRSVIEAASLVVLTKNDMLPFIEFDVQEFSDGVRSINNQAVLLELSAITGKGIPRLANWLHSMQKQKRLLGSKFRAGDQVLAEMLHGQEANEIRFGSV